LSEDLKITIPPSVRASTNGSYKRPPSTTPTTGFSRFATRPGKVEAILSGFVRLQ